MIALSVLILRQIVVLYAVDFVQKSLIADPKTPGSLSAVPSGFNQHLENCLPFGPPGSLLSYFQQRRCLGWVRGLLRYLTMM